MWFLVACLFFGTVLQCWGMVRARKIQGPMRDKLARAWEEGRGAAGPEGEVEGAELLQALGGQTCGETARVLRKEYWRARWSNGVVLIFRQPKTGFGRFSDEGKARQEATDIDRLFKQANDINDRVQDMLARMVQEDIFASLREQRGGGWAERGGDRVWGGELLRGPVKTPHRVLQKCVRKYRRDFRCLTDLVRCMMVFESMWEVERAWRFIRSRSEVGFEAGSSEGATRQGSIFSSSTRVSAVQMEAVGVEGNGEAEWGGEGGSSEEEKIFRLVRVKNRFNEKSPHHDERVGYRDLTINLEVRGGRGQRVEGGGGGGGGLQMGRYRRESSADAPASRQVGWVYREGELDFLPVKEWEVQMAERHVIEVQLHLRSIKEALGKEGHRTYEQWRNVLHR